MDVDDTELETILALQVTVAWAGEALSEPPRLGWWRTDLVDAAGGGSLFQDLFSRTHRWASLEAVRQAAADTDRRARRHDTLLDELRERLLRELRAGGKIRIRLV